MAWGARGARLLAAVLCASGLLTVLYGSPGRASTAPGRMQVPVVNLEHGDLSQEAPGGKPVANVTWAIASDIVRFDPAFAYGDNSTPVVSQSCEGLLRFSPTGSLVPNLATSWRSPNPLTYVYQVRKAVRFWNGAPMTASDVLFSMQRVMNTATHAFAASYYANVKSITRTGAWQITVKLKRPDRLWKYVPAMSATGAVMSKAYALAHPDNLGQPGVGVMCTGPFQFERWDRGKAILLQRFDGYWRAAGLPKVKDLTFKIVPTAPALLKALDSGKVDGTLYGFDGRLAQQLKGKLNLLTSDSDTYVGLYFNTTKRPWSDIRVRQAFAYALDRTAIVSSVYNALGQNPKSPITPIMWTYGKDAFARAYDLLPNYNIDIERAQQLVAAAGAKGAKGTLLVSTPTDLRAALFIEQAASQLGITLTVRMLPVARKMAIETAVHKTFDLDLVSRRTDTPDPLSALVRGFDPANVASNITGYRNPIVTRAIAAAQTAPTSAIEAANTIKAQAQIMKDVPVIPYIVIDTAVPLNWRLTGFKPTFFTYWTAWAADLSGAR
jgi:peptide/nickel transport system substrate-binding protein